MVKAALEVLACFALVSVLPIVTEAGYDTGTFVLETGSLTTRLNITVVYEKCFDIAASFVESKATPTDSTRNETFRVYPFKINKLSFEAILERQDAKTGWNFMSLNISWKIYFPSSLYNQQPGGYNIHYYYRSSSTITWQSHKDFCIQQGYRLCTADEICPKTPTKRVLITGTTWGDDYTPISASLDWIEVGDNLFPGKFCRQYRKMFGLPGFGNQTGGCSPYNTPTNPCYLKGHAYCCN